jgi:hypothetical protein
MGTRISLVQGVVIPNSHNLPEIKWQESRYKAVRLVLMDVPQFVRQKTCCAVAATDKNGMAKCKANHARTEKARLQRRHA